MIKTSIAIFALLSLTGCASECSTREPEREPARVEYRPAGGWPTATPHYIRTPSNPELNETWRQMYEGRTRIEQPAPVRNYPRQISLQEYNHPTEPIGDQIPRR
jgi:hypothetical protein